MGFKDAVVTGLRKYAVFDGRATRPEFWYFWLAYLVVGTILSVLAQAADVFAVLYLLFVLGVFLPNLGVAVRRLHDIDRSGWWVCIAFVPLVGAILLIVWACTAGTPGPNRFGQQPGLTRFT